MLLLVGLGNPGPGYAKHRHNIGFMAVDAIADRHGFGPFRARFHGRAAEGEIAGRKALALKPETFMNESGRAVAAAAAFYKIPPADVIVLHDEIDLACGKVRIKRGGGHAGHNGLRSIHAHLGPDYARMRLGIGHPGEKDAVTGHVLRNFSKADAKWVETLLDAVAEHAGLLVEGRDSDFMSKLAQAVRPPRPRKPKEPPTSADQAGGKGAPDGGDGV
ncbi:MAG: aminoacyl-tRNA hydrolase [Rhodospirillales bacterium]